MARILVVDDDEDVRAFLVGTLETAGHDVHEADDGIAGLQATRAHAFDVVVTDLKMPRLDGLGLLKELQRRQPEVVVIMLTAHGSVAGAVEAMKHGCFDYLEKPISSPADLRTRVARAVESRTRADGDGPEAPTLTWGAPAMVGVTRAITKVARTQATVLLTGESGTGKEVTAKALHALSPRRAGPFVAVNCAVLSPGLLESELFGHEKGAFTSAEQRRIGKLEAANGGTFFLDEVGELAPDLQAKLLRALQERCFERVGGNQTIRIDVRFVAATNRDLPEQIRKGRFREDLYHRLAVFPVHLPPLRERREDVGPLAEVLLRRIGRQHGRPTLMLTPEATDRLAAQSWPGNARELANTLERAAILADGDHITPDDLMLTANTTLGTSAGSTVGSERPLTMAQAEKKAIEDALELHDGHRRKAADHLGIGLRTLYDKLKRYGIR